MGDKNIHFSSEDLEKLKQDYKELYTNVGMAMAQKHETAPNTIRLLEGLKENFATEIEGLKKWLEEKFETNEDCHKALIEQTTKTNGSVKKLQIWKAGLASAITVVIFFVGMFNWFLRSSVEKLNYLINLKPVTLEEVRKLIDDNNQFLIKTYGK